MLAYQLLCPMSDYREYIIGYDCDQFKNGIYVNLKLQLCNM